MEKKKVVIGLTSMFMGALIVYGFLQLTLSQHGDPGLAGNLLLLAFLAGGFTLIGLGWEYATGIKIPLPRKVRNVFSHLIMMFVGAVLTVACGGSALWLLLYEASAPSSKIFAPFLGLGFLFGLVMLYMSAEPLIQRYKKNPT